MSFPLMLSLCLSCAATLRELDAPPPIIQPVRIPVYKVLAMEIETKDFQEPMPLKQALQLFYEKFAAQGISFPCLVDINAFRAEDKRAENEISPNGPYDDEVKLPSVPRMMTVTQALRIFISQIKSSNGAYIVRDGTIVITTRKQAALPTRMQELLVARFAKTPLTDVAEKLSDMAGATIVIDARLKEKAMLPITAEFRGDVTLCAALTTIADMADARLVHLDNCLYVTTRENAEVLERRQRERKEETLREQERQARLKSQI